MASFFSNLRYSAVISFVGPDAAQMAVVEPGDLVAHTLDLVNGVADQNNRGTAGQQLRHALFALFLEQEVAHRQNLVGNQDVGLRYRRHGEGQARHHAGRVVFQRHVEKILQFAELDDIVEF